MSRASQALVKAMNLTASIVTLNSGSQRCRQRRQNVQSFVPAWHRHRVAVGSIDRSKRLAQNVAAVLLNCSIEASVAQVKINTKNLQWGVLFDHADEMNRAKALPPLARNGKDNISQKIGGFARNDGYSQPKDIELDERLREANYQFELDEIVQVKHLNFWKTVKLLTANFFNSALFWLRFIWLNRHLSHLDSRQFSHASLSIVAEFLAVLLEKFCKTWVLAIAKGVRLVFSSMNLPSLSIQQKQDFWLDEQLLFGYRLGLPCSQLTVAIGTVCDRKLSCFLARPAYLPEISDFQNPSFSLK